MTAKKIQDEFDASRVIEALKQIRHARPPDISVVSGMVGDLSLDKGRQYPDQREKRRSPVTDLKNLVAEIFEVL